MILDDDHETVLDGGHINAERFVALDKSTALTEDAADRAIAILL